MKDKMKFGLLTYEDSPSGEFNVGDHIQSIAAKQYLPQVDKLVNRDNLNSLELEEKTSVIMNGWYTHKPENWPPVKLLNPLFVSFHLNSKHAGVLLSKRENIDYLKKYEPIGCRDIGTVEALSKHGIKAYYSSCLTTTLDLKFYSEEKNDEILIVDILYKNDYKAKYRKSLKRLVADIVKGRFSKRNDRDKAIKAIIPPHILEKAKYVTHSYKNRKYSEEERFELATDLIRRYSKAKLVITSRIHCALPCLALGTPVVFIVGGDLFKDSEMSRLRGTIEHMNVISTEPIGFGGEISGNINLLNPKDVDWENIVNPKSYKEYANDLKVKCTEFINVIQSK